VPNSQRTFWNLPEQGYAVRKASVARQSKTLQNCRREYTVKNRRSHERDNSRGPENTPYPDGVTLPSHNRRAQEWMGPPMVNL